MTTVTALAAAGLIARLCLAARQDLPVGDVQIQGDVTYQPSSGRLVVENGAVLRRGDVVVRAATATYDPATGEVRATGGVLLTDATRIVFAEALRAVLGGTWEAEGVVAFVKEKPADLSSITDVDEARRAGRNRATFSGSRLEGDRLGRFRLEGARLTLCDCPSGAPSWEVTTRKADVVAGKGATLTWPVLRITPRFLLIDRPVPVLVLPWLYVPLGERQTGFLVPEVRSTGATGFTIAQPLFVTLGRSWDLTLTPQYAFGIDPGDVGGGAAAVRGPGATLEVRWAPAVGTEGRAELGWFHDLDREPGGEGGGRFAVAAGHVQRLTERTGLAAGLRLAGDPVWVRDFTEDWYGQRVPYRRSDLLVSRRGEALVLEAGLGYLQPLCPDGVWSEGDPGRPPGVSTCQGYGTFGAGLDQASRSPAVSATLVPVAAGPLRLAGRAGAARFAPVSGAFDRTATADRPARPAAARADAQAELSLPLVLGRALSFAPYLRGAAAGYAFEADAIAVGGDPARSLEPAASAWAVAGAVLGTEVSRRFGALRHAIAPRVEWRAGTAVAGDALDWLAYDALDRTGAGLLASGPPGAWQQLRAAVETRLSRDGADVARLELGQDFDLGDGRFAETFASLGVAAGRVGFDAAARFLAVDDRAEPAPTPAIPSAFLDRFTELRANLSLSDGRGDVLRAGYFAVGPGGSGPLVAGLDPLFDLRPARLDAAAGASAGVRIAAGGGATIGYDAQFPGRATPPVPCPGGDTREVGAWTPTQQTARFEWDSPCRCFRFTARLGVNQCGVVSYGVALDLSRATLPRGGR